MVGHPKALHTSSYVHRWGYHHGAHIVGPQGNVLVTLACAMNAAVSVDILFYNNDYMHNDKDEG